MNTIAGYITAEVYVDRSWTYVYPRSGVYFRYPDGSLVQMVAPCMSLRARGSPTHLSTS